MINILSPLCGTLLCIFNCVSQERRIIAFHIRKSVVVVMREIINKRRLEIEEIIEIDSRHINECDGTKESSTYCGILPLIRINRHSG